MSDILSHGPEGPRRRLPRWVGAVGAVVVLAAVVAALALRAGDGGSGEHTPTVSTSAVPTRGARTVAAVPTPTVRPGQTAAVALSRRTAFGKTLDRRDPGAAHGPWAVIVRRHDGSLGRHGAVISYPAPDSHFGHRVRVGDVVGRAYAHTVTWPLGDKRARIRGDLSERRLVRIAASTRTEHSRPRVRAPDGFTVVAAEPYRSPHVREVRYGPAELVAAGKLEGMVYTGLTRGGAFEDRLYATDVGSGWSVHGHPAVLSSVGGGNAALAWEPSPGVVAYVGYSGVPLSHDAIATLAAVADRTIPLSLSQWRATHPAHAHATNDYT